MIQHSGLTTLRYYYLATPVFFVLHAFFDVDIRVAIPAAQEYWYYLYYAVCFIAGVAVFGNALLGAMFSLLESSVNILLLLLSVYRPIVDLGQLATQDKVSVFGPIQALHFILVGTVLLVSFYQNPLIKTRR